MEVQRRGLAANDLVFPQRKRASGLGGAGLQRPHSAACEPELLALAVLPDHWNCVAHFQPLPPAPTLIWNSGVHGHYSPIMGMSTPYELTGRTHQKARTRSALIAAARQLLAG